MSQERDEVTVGSATTLASLPAAGGCVERAPGAAAAPCYECHVGAVPQSPVGSRGVSAGRSACSGRAEGMDATRPAHPQGGRTMKRSRISWVVGLALITTLVVTAGIAAF